MHHTELDRVMSRCAFPATSYAPSATALVQGIQGLAPEAAATPVGDDGQGSIGLDSASVENSRPEQNNSPEPSPTSTPEEDSAEAPYFLSGAEGKLGVTWGGMAAVGLGISMGLGMGLV